LAGKGSNFNSWSGGSSKWAPRSDAFALGATHVAKTRKAGQIHWISDVAKLIQRHPQQACCKECRHPKSSSQKRRLMRAIPAIAIARFNSAIVYRCKSLATLTLNSVSLNVHLFHHWRTAMLRSFGEQS
jgi:hypothetical protein